MENIITNRNMTLANADFRDRNSRDVKDELEKRSSYTNEKKMKKEKKSRKNSKCKEVIQKQHIILESDCKDEKKNEKEAAENALQCEAQSSECDVVSRTSDAPGDKEIDAEIKNNNDNGSSFSNNKKQSDETLNSFGSDDKELRKSFNDHTITLQPEDSIIRLRKSTSQVDSATKCAIIRKSSFENDVLSRRVSLSKSEMDLHVMGRSPLQRKSSFFRKTLNSLVRNTSEVFRRQSEKRERKSTTSHSLQSLYDQRGEIHGEGVSALGSRLPENKCINDTSTTSLELCSGSSACSTISDGIGQRGSNSTASSMQSLSGLPLNEAMISSRAFSVSSGLDSVHQPKRSDAAKTNRYTWMASDSVADYLRRKVQEEIASRGSRDNRGSTNSFRDSHLDVSTSSAKTAEPNKGRRLSYQRAVSGEDPVLPHRYNDRRQYRIPEDNDEINSVKTTQFLFLLESFTKDGVPELDGFEQERIEDGGYGALSSLTEQRLDELFKPAGDLLCMFSGTGDLLCMFSGTAGICPPSRLGQAIKELILTEAGFITQIQFIVTELMAAAHAVQLHGYLTNVNMELVFCNLPDILNGHIQFWNNTLHPMLTDAFKHNGQFNTNLLLDGFTKIKVTFNCYQIYALLQQTVKEYIKSQTQIKEFREFRDWCAAKKSANRQHLSDLMMKPIQRLTKYSLLIQAMINETSDNTKKGTLEEMLDICKDFVNMLNLLVRYKEECDAVARLNKLIGPLEIDCREDDVQTLFRKYNYKMLEGPIVGCPTYMQRSLIYEGDIKFRDATAQKIDVRVFLLTDLMLICKRLPGRHLPYQFRLIRPKYEVDKIIYRPSTFVYKGLNVIEMQYIICVVTDQTGAATTWFTLHSSSREPNVDLMTWYHKLQEASYSLNYARASHNSSTLNHAIEENKPELGEHDELFPFVLRSQASIRRDAKERAVVMSMGYDDRANTSCDHITSLDYQQYYDFGLDSRSQREQRQDPNNYQPLIMNKAEEEFRLNMEDKNIQAARLTNSLLNVPEYDFGNFNHEPVKNPKKSASKVVYAIHQEKMKKMKIETMERLDGQTPVINERGLSFLPPSHSHRSLRRGMALAMTNRELKPPVEKIHRARSAHTIILREAEDKEQQHQAVHAINETLLHARKKNKPLFNSYSDITDDNETENKFFLM